MYETPRYPQVLLGARALSAPFKPEEYETILPYMKEHAEKNGISFYHEKELIVTDLFGNMDLSGIWVFIRYKDPVTLEKCLKLKEDKAKLLESGSYEGEARSARAFMG